MAIPMKSNYELDLLTLAYQKNEVLKESLSKVEIGDYYTVVTKCDYDITTEQGKKHLVHSVVKGSEDKY